MSKSDFNINCKQESLTYILPCRVLNKYNLTKMTGIPVNFEITERLEIPNLLHLQNGDYLQQNSAKKEIPH